MRNSTVRGNIAEASGGGSAQGGGTARGGDLFNAVGSTTLNQSTVTRNKAGDGGGAFEASGTVTLNGTTVKLNKPDNCAPPGAVPGCTG